MDQLDSMRSFVRVVDEGGFAAAARSLGRSRSVVNRAVIALETALGTPLLRRSTRQVSPTDAGALFYERALPILAQVDAAMGAVAELRSEPTGTLRVNAPMSFGTGCLSPIAAAFLARYP
ncbi:MAG: LysR family transcriptional regulator, partial [Pseudomonadota bacterium]